MAEVPSYSTSPVTENKISWTKQLEEEKRNSMSAEMEVFLSWILLNISYLLCICLLQQLVATGFHHLMGVTFRLGTAPFLTGLFASTNFLLNYGSY